MKNIENSFDEKIKEGTVIVDFWASWCGPCKMFEPIFEEVSKINKSIKFCKFNVDEDNSDVSRKLGVMSIPTIILFKDGKEIKRNVGLISKENLEEFIRGV